LPGECGFVMAFIRKSSGRSFSHAHCAFPTKKRCSGVSPSRFSAIGVQHLDGSGLIAKQYSQTEIATAESEFRNISRIVERYARNIPGLSP